jgi:hypothetical protein
MATTLRYLIYDALEALRQNLDDRNIQPSQVAFWTINIANRLKAQHIEKSKRDSMAFMTPFVLPVIVPTASERPYANRKYFDLPAVIFDFDLDKGIDYIVYASNGNPGCPPNLLGTSFTRTRPANLATYATLSYTRPCPNNPYYYRTTQHVVLSGIETIDVKFLEVGLYTAIPSVNDINIDDPFEFPEELNAILIRQLLDLGRFAVTMPADKINDGTQELSAQPFQGKLASVNQLSQPQAEQQ